MTTNFEDIDPMESHRDLWLFAAAEVNSLLSDEPELTGREVAERLYAAAQQAPEIPMPRLFHLAPEEGPAAVCGETPGPDRLEWHHPVLGDTFIERLLEGRRVYPMCLLGAATVLQRQRAEAAGG